MNKLFTKIATLALGATMAVGVGVAVASNAKEPTKVEAAVTWTSVGSLSVGDEIVIANATAKKELTGVSSNIGTATDYSTADNPNGTFLLTVEAGSTSGSYALKNGSNYLAYTGSGNNLHTTTSIGDNSSWTIDGSAGSIRLYNVQYSTRRLVYNSGSPRFCCYTSNQTALTLYKKSGGSGPTKLPAPTNVAASGSTLTWSNVTNNNGYTYTINTSPATTNDLAKDATSFDASTLSLDPGNYTFAIKAKGDGSSYSDSDYCTAVPFTIESGSYTSVYSTGFESSEGFTASTQYNTTKVVGPTGKQWTMYYGTPATGSPIAGSQSAQMRWYSSATSNYPYIKTDFSSSNIKKISFKYKVGNTNVDFKVQSSTNGSTWTDIETVNTTGTSITDYSKVLDSAISTFYLRILVCLGTAPSSGNYEFRVDSVLFEAEVSSDPYITPEKVAAEGYVGQNETVSFTYGNLTSTLGVTSSDTSVVTVGTPSASDGSGSVQFNYVGVGSTTVKFKDGSTELASVAVEVSTSSVTITGLPATSYAYIGKTADLGSTITVTATGIYTDAVTWTTEDPSIATVNASGVVSGVSAGEVDITVTSNEYPSATMTCTVTVMDTPTYIFATNFSTYASTWNTTYGQKTLNGKTDVGGTYDATIVLERANKQTSGVGSEEPFLASPKSTTTSPILVFTLNETGYKITKVIINFTNRGDAAPTFNLYKGNACSGTALDTAVIGTSNSLETLNLNDSAFSLDCVATNQSNNVGAALTSIYIEIEEVSQFGTLDHITITSLPNTVYHVGETFDATGLAVTAYDGADESTANFKDVTSLVETDLDDPTPFVDGDVPGFDCDVQYTGDGGSDTKSFHVYVYALAEYELVTSEPSDWSGEYLIVAENNSKSYAMNGALSQIDVDGNHKEVTPDANNVIEAGQELEWVIAPTTGGYSIKGKSNQYIGSKTDKSNGLLVGDSPITNTLSFSDGDVAITGTNTYNLKFNADGSGRFRYYQSGTVKLYKLKESQAVSDYADLFLNMLTVGEGGADPVCDPQGVDTDVEALITAWGLLAEEYDSSLTSGEKEQFRLGVPSEAQGASNLAKCLALYDWIAARYNTRLQTQTLANYDFMNRNVSPSGIASNNLIIKDTSAMIPVIVVISIVSVSAIGGYFFLRKRKETN